MPEETQQPTPQPQVENKIKNNRPILKFILILEIIVILFGVAYVGYLYTTKDKEITTNNSILQSEKFDYNNWETYTDTKFNYSIKYPGGWSVVKGGGRKCASLGGYRSVDNICFQSPDFVSGKTTGIGIHVEGRPYNNDEYQIICSDVPSIQECQKLNVAGQDALKQLARSSQVMGTLHVDEMYSFTGKNNESSMFIIITYFRCQEDNNKDCTRKEDADKFSTEVISSFKFLD